MRTAGRLWRLLTRLWSLLWLVDLSKSQIKSEKITLLEGETYFHDFNELVFKKKNSLPFLFDTNSTGLIEYNKTEHHILDVSRVFESTLDSSESFTDARCSIETSGWRNLVSIIYTRPSTTNGSKFYVEVKSLVYQNKNNTDVDTSVMPIDLFRLNLTQNSFGQSLCTSTIIVNELNRIVLVCSASINNQFYVVMLCSDNSCSEKIEVLKITEYQRNQNIESLVMMRMPGISSTTFSMFFYFQNTPQIEYMIFNNNGNIESTVYTLTFDVIRIRYFSGQLLVVEGVDKHKKQIISYSFFDFGIYKVNFDKMKLRQMSEFGVFANSFVNAMTGEINVEMLSGETLAGLSLDRTTYEFAVEFSKVIPESNIRRIFIFEIGGAYQMITFGSATNPYDLNKVAIMSKNGFINASNETMPSITGASEDYAKVQGFYQISGCRINKVAPNDTKTWKAEVYDVNFRVPYVQLFGVPSLANREKSHKIVISSKTTKDELAVLEVKILPRDQFKLGQKTLLTPQITIITDEIATEDEMLLSEVIHGNFLFVLKLKLQSGEEIKFNNKVNPYSTT